MLFNTQNWGTLLLGPVESLTALNSLYARSLALIGLRSLPVLTLTHTPNLKRDLRPRLLPLTRTGTLIIGPNRAAYPLSRRLVALTKPVPGSLIAMIDANVLNVFIRTCAQKQ